MLDIFFTETTGLIAQSFDISFAPLFVHLLHSDKVGHSIYIRIVIPCTSVVLDQTGEGCFGKIILGITSSKLYIASQPTSTHLPLM